MLIVKRVLMYGFSINLKSQVLILFICFQLMDGRKSVGGKLEVKMKIRDPFTSKQVEETKEKWLIIDHFDRALPKVILY